MSNKCGVYTTEVNSDMTPEELVLMGITGALWNKFLEMNKEHPSDQDEFRFHLHAIQNIIVAQVGMRIYRSKVHDFNND